MRLEVVSPDHQRAQYLEWCGAAAEEFNAAGVERHARRALELLSDARRTLPSEQSDFAGMSLAHVEGVASSLLRDAPARFASPSPACLLTEWLPLGDW